MSIYGIVAPVVVPILFVVVRSLGHMLDGTPPHLARRRESERATGNGVHRGR
jgi:hypothetical protein